MPHSKGFSQNCQELDQSQVQIKPVNSQFLYFYFLWWCFFAIYATCSFRGSRSWEGHATILCRWLVTKSSGNS